MEPRTHSRGRWIGVGAAASLLIVFAGLALWQIGVIVPGHPSPTRSATWEAPVMTTNDPPPAAVSIPMSTTDEVNVRLGPGIEYGVARVLPFNTGVTVTGESVNGFAPVEIDGAQAWVSSEYLAEPSAVVAPVPAEAPAEAERPDTTAAVVSNAPEADDLENAPAVSTERWIEIDRSDLTVTLRDGDAIVAVFPALMGRDPSPDGYYSTAVGTYHVFSMEKTLTETPFAEGVYLTDFVGFDPVRSNGIHSPVRDADGNVVVTGGTVTMGCVRLSADDAVTVFTFAHIGMRVEVHD